MMRRVCLASVLTAVCLGEGSFAAAPDSPLPGPFARALLERFKALEGRWKGRSTKGWEDEVVVRVIANGSVVEMASFDAHPGEQMRTLVHLDGERLMLTHYCVAGNQPRLLAASFDQASETATFAFHDATNLPSRDRGHMDKAVYHFEGPDRYTTRWTWYQEGKERWMEEIAMSRLP